VPTEVIWNSSCSAFGYTLEAGHPILVGDVQEESRFCDPMLIAQGIQWGAICPITYRAQQYGAIGVFCTDRCPIAKDDVLFLQSVALLLGPTRAHQKTERALAEHSRFLSTAIDSLDAIVVLLDASGAVLQINHACQSWGGFSADQLFGRKLWSAFFLPGEEESIRNLIQDAANGESQRRCDAYFLSKHGDRRRVSWTVARLPSAAGDATFLATGIDVTDQHNAMSMLQEMKANLTEASKQQASNALGAAKAEDEKGRERRKHDRRPYSCVQLIAPCIAGNLPARKDFREVKCHDISPRGFSFLLEAKPEFDDLVVAFGAAQAQLFLRAKVKHISSIHHVGRIYMKVGCEYLGRVRLPSPPESAKAS
jgi:PAS domain S-box-containing protein